MGTTPQDALGVEARRQYRLLWLNSLEVLRKALVVGITINGASRGLPENVQGRLNPSPVRPLYSTARAGHLTTHAGATADRAASRGAQRRTSRTRAYPNRETAAQEEARVDSVASMARDGDIDLERSRRGNRERSRRGERDRW